MTFLTRNTMLKKSVNGRRLKNAFFQLHVFLITLLIGNQALSQNNKHMKEQSIVIGFVGDIMLGRLVNKKISQTSYDSPWGNVASLLKKNDLNIGNLETTLTTSTDKIIKAFNFKSRPSNVKVLSAGHIHIVNLANNHILDFSVPGMIETIKALDKAHILHVGAGKNLAEAQKPVIITKKGVKIGIIGITDNEEGWAAQKNKPGTFYVRVGDVKRITPIIKNLRPQVDILIVSNQWGPNMREYPTKEFQKFAHDLIDAGVDIFHGHSAHILQPIEWYNKKLILYDTGDFIDDYAIDPILRNDQSMLFNVTVNKNGVQKLDMIPLIIKNIQVNKADDKEAQAILKTIEERSQRMRALNAS